MNPKRKWFTCAPVRFQGNQMFFSRDSGLLCKGFQELGIECKAILPGPPMDDDQVSDLIRTDYSNLQDPNWWASLGGDGVVFYGWGSGKYLKIARAIKQAGMVFVSHMDTGGTLGILNGVADFGGSLWRRTQGEANHTISGTANFLARFTYATTVGLVRNDMQRARHLKKADVIGAISPIALDRIRRVCRIYGGKSLESRVHLIPHPNAAYMRADPAVVKERLLVAVGRWTDHKVKGTGLLMSICQRLLQTDPALRIEIFGRHDENMINWHQSLQSHERDRVRVRGIAPNSEIKIALQRARVELCTSLRESYHITSAEALCCGATVVGPRTPEIPSMKWFTGGPFGTIADRNAPALAEAVKAELEAWDRGERNPQQISDHWSGILHAPKVAQRILNLTKQR